MKIVRLKTAFEDVRGAVVDILAVPIEHVTLFTSKRGAVRGNHYHKKTTQYAYVLKGKLRLYTQHPGQPVRRRLIRQGDLVITPPRERHAFVALEDSALLTFAHGPRHGRSYEQDTFRLTEPLA